MQREIAIMKKCRHKNIVPLYEVIDDPGQNHIYLVMQYIEHGPVVSLGKDGRANRQVEPDVAMQYARQLLAGLQYLHNHNVVHRDIKPDNILLGEHDRVFLSDFGVSALLTSDSSPKTPLSPSDGAGTAAFKSPEHVAAVPSFASVATTAAPCEDEDATADKASCVPAKGDVLECSADSGSVPPVITPVMGLQQAAETADVWALGLTLYVMLFGRLPWTLDGGVDAYYSNVAAAAEIPMHFDDVVAPRMRLSDAATAKLREQWQGVLSGLLRKEPRERWSVKAARLAVRAACDELDEAAVAESLDEDVCPPLTEITA